MTKRAERSESNQSTGGLLLVLTLLLIQHVEGQPRLCARTDFLLSSWYLDQIGPNRQVAIRISFAKGSCLAVLLLFVWTADFHSYKGHVLT